MASKFQKATREKAKVRFALSGPSGSGKTYTACSIMSSMCSKYVVFDTERGSASKYAAGSPFDFDVLNVEPPFSPKQLVIDLHDAVKEGYEGIIIDSLTHYWNGSGGFLELVEDEAKRNTRGNSFTAWKSIDPLYRKLMDTITQLPAHVIFCMRAKQEYSQDKDERGKTKIEKLGMAPEMRSGSEYEADIEGVLNMDNDLVIGKTRCPELKGKVFNQAGKDVASILLNWLNTGVERKVVPVAPPSAPASSPKLIEHNPEDDQTAERYIQVANGSVTIAELVDVLKEAKTKVGHRADLLMEFRKVYSSRAAEIKAWDELQAQESVTQDSDVNGAA